MDSNAGVQVWLCVAFWSDADNSVCDDGSITQINASAWKPCYIIPAHFPSDLAEVVPGLVFNQDAVA